MRDSEQALRTRLRRKQLRGIQFYRQKPIENSVGDFSAPKAKLVIEIDGSQHLSPENIQKDLQHSATLERQGLKVLRFNNLRVLQELDSVEEAIFQALLESEKIIPQKPPLPKGA
jgi:very-short-patch-repair endonuclease